MKSRTRLALVAARLFPWPVAGQQPNFMVIRFHARIEAGEPSTGGGK